MLTRSWPKVPAWNRRAMWPGRSPGMLLWWRHFQAPERQETPKAAFGFSKAEWVSCGSSRRTSPSTGLPAMEGHPTSAWGRRGQNCRICVALFFSRIRIVNRKHMNLLTSMRGTMGRSETPAHHLKQVITHRKPNI